MSETDYLLHNAWQKACERLTLQERFADDEAPYPNRRTPRTKRRIKQAWLIDLTDLVEHGRQVRRQSEFERFLLAPN